MESPKATRTGWVSVAGACLEASHQPFELQLPGGFVQLSLLGTRLSWSVCVSIEIRDDCASHVHPFSLPPV